MDDGAELARAIAANPEDVEAELLAYETDLGANEAQAANRVQEALFGDNWPHSLLNFFAAIQPVKQLPARILCLASPGS